MLWLFANAAVVVSRPMHGLSFIDMLGFALITGLVAIAIVLVAWRSGTSVGWAREVILRARVCPNCHDELPDPKYVHPTFDGCTACANCGRAWRIGEA